MKELHSWKFAANAVWEEALAIDAKSPIDWLLIENWISSNPQNIAFEAIFSEEDLPSTMFGIRITSLSKPEQALRIKRFLERTDTIKSESDFKKVAAEILPEFILFGILKAVNIGVVSQWYSVGPETLWQRGDLEPLSWNKLQEKAPKFFDPTKNPVAVEFWYTEPVDHWYKIYVSDKCLESYSINELKYQNALDQLAAFI